MSVWPSCLIKHLEITDVWDFFLNRKLIPVESLSCENVLYWRALCEFIKARGDDGDELLEQVLPDAATYADYLYK